MKTRAILLLLVSVVATVSAQTGGSAATRAPGTGYTLLEGSYFVDECQICGRPTILQPMRGTFELVLLQNTAPFTEYAVRNIDFTAAPGFAGEVRIKGSGFYRRFEEFAVLQDMVLTTQVADSFTNRAVVFTNDSRLVEKPFPLIEISLTESNGTLFRTFSLHLIAAPIHEVWFSITKPMSVTNASGATSHVSPGDLLSNRGRVVKSNLDLVGRLGVMPSVPDLGLDAVDVIKHGEILFSIPQDVFSETLGPIQHGDLLSNRGRIVKRNQQLLAAFGVAPNSQDAGLDAVEVMADGEILFSIQSSLTLTTAQKLGRGDLLSDRGHVLRSNRQLLEHFHPAVTNLDYGLDAVSVLPTGEIWFSVEQGFTDNQLGPIEPGDVLSDQGRRIFSNRQLVAAFGPLDPSVDYGLDALFVVTALRPPQPTPKFLSLWCDRTTDRVCMDWDGDGAVFQVEGAASVSGPWAPCSPLVPDLSFEDVQGVNGRPCFFYRLRQW